MIYQFPQEKRVELLPLFKEYKYMEAIALGLLVSDLGKVFVDDLKNPRNAILVYGERPTIIVFGGSGEGETAKKLLSKITNKSGFICPNDKWEALVKERLGDKIKLKPRTKFSSSNLNIEHIKNLKKNIPNGYKIVKINNEIIDKFEENTKQKLIRFVGSLDKFKKDGFGFAAIKDGKVVAEITNGGLTYKKAIEIDIETHPDHRRKGLATILAAYMIEYCLENGLDPRWDAANNPSVALALKLGYTNPKEYEVMIYWED